MSYGIYTQEGIKKGLINITEDESVITYIHHNITRNYKNPEERVQAEIFCKLILWYKYPVEKIGLYVPVTDGSTKKQADIFVYNDINHTSPLIVIECKKEDVSEQEFAQATNQAFSYAHFTAGTIKYVWTTSGIKNAYFKFDKESSVRETVSDIPQHGIKKLSSYKYAYNGGTTASGQQLFPLAKVTESELTNIFKQAHQALWGGGELNPSEAFDELDKLIFCKIFDEKKDRDVGEPYDFQVIPVEPENNTEEAKAKAEAETNKRLLKRLTALYEEGRQIGERKNDPEIFKDNIKLNAAKARTVVSYLEGVDLLSTDLDSKGRAFETFMGSFFRGDFGQYFTPRNIVSFIVDSLPITNKSRVLDTSCGSGGFLLHALDKVRKAATQKYPNYKADIKTEKGLCSSSSKLAAPGSVLLVVRSGILQHTIPVSVCSVPMAINQDIKVLTPNDDVLPAFLGYYFIVFNKMLLPRIVKHSTTVQSINSFELGKLPIPIPSLSIQKEIIEILDTAYAQKKEKDHQSEELLENINSYLNNAWYKSFTGVYADDLVCINTLLNFMSHFESAEEIKSNVNMQGEYFNAYTCQALSEDYRKKQNKLPIEPVPSANLKTEYFFNQRGAKVYIDAQKQPMISIPNGSIRCKVLSVGADKNMLPLITVEEDGNPVCYRLPLQLSEWAFAMVAISNMGQNLFPSEVVFSKKENNYYADII